MNIIIEETVENVIILVDEVTDDVTIQVQELIEDTTIVNNNRSCYLFHRHRWIYGVVYYFNFTNKFKLWQIFNLM